MLPLTESGDIVYLLDTSALLTFIEDEDGSGRVEEVLRREGTLLPRPVLMETYYISLREEGRAEADRRYALIRHLEVEILWDMNEQILLIAARLKLVSPSSVFPLSNLGYDGNQQGLQKPQPHCQ